MNKQTYFISINQGSRIEIFTERTDPSLIQYEVQVDEAEIEEFLNLVHRFREKDVEPEQIFVRPFNEPAADRDKEELKYDTRELFEMIYRYGTEKTKRDLEELQKQNSRA
ncbi:hypothetical protein [Alteribacter aurantiacus]|uniref:hypothetical protein n=1 Tax=Alteribacter aurantiacus TaxID=254410 RepID=UPI000409F2FB|nr:hypothetical protein [Alteribacter aurantiacus]